jgi:hypothetical protein
VLGALQLDRMGLVQEEDLGPTFLAAWRDGGMSVPSMFTLRSGGKAALVAARADSLYMK